MAPVSASPRCVSRSEGTFPLGLGWLVVGRGYLDLQSEVGVGTTDTVRFPAERVIPAPRSVNCAAAPALRFRSLLQFMICS